MHLYWPTNLFSYDEKYIKREFVQNLIMKIYNSISVIKFNRILLKWHYDMLIPISSCHFEREELTGLVYV
jgi:hypothetical protein